MNPSVIERNIAEEPMQFLRESALFWEAKKALILSDLHAGKAAHFRHNGIPLSSDHLLHDLNRIDGLIERLGPERLVVLGDLFHSHHNEENALVVDWLHQLDIPHLLVEGNHDRHSVEKYGLNCVPEWEEGPFLMRHEPGSFDGRYQINGHLHPAFALRGKAKQHMRLPAFYMDRERLILPAFGSLTGMKTVRPTAHSSFILIGPGGLVPLDQDRDEHTV